MKLKNLQYFDKIVPEAEGVGEQPAIIIVMEGRKINCMDHQSLKFTNSILFFLIAVMTGLYFGASFFVPIAYSAFIAALMVPFSNLLEKAPIRRSLSSLISTLLVLIILGDLLYLLYSQLKQFADDLPELKEEVTGFFNSIQVHFSSATGISPEEQEQIISERSELIVGMVQEGAANMLGGFMDMLYKFLLLLVYVFLFLLYRQRFSSFVMQYVAHENKNLVQSILEKTAKVIHHYLWGRIKVMTILAGMYLVVFLFFDLRYVILLTVFGALITIIPYIGPLISGLLPVIFMVVFGGSTSEVMLLAGLIIVIQLIETYILEPIIIGSEVHLNPLAVIISIIIGGMIWGVSGMILFVPVFAIIKIISDHTPALKPIGYLLGDKEIKPKKYFGNSIKNMFKKQT